MKNRLIYDNIIMGGNTPCLSAVYGRYAVSSLILFLWD